jgi:glycosyltransferase involved in cell wall biosynthesis
MAPAKWSYVPNGVDPDEWSQASSDIPREHADALARFKADGRFIVGYAGSHGIANGLRSFVESAAELDDRHVTHVLVGQGPEKDDLERLAAERAISNVTFLPPVPKTSVPALLSAFDVGFVGWRRQPIARLGVSHNKTFDYMMASRPLLYAVDAGNDFAQESGGGITIEPESTAAIVTGVGRFLDMSPRDREAMGRRGRAYVLANHTYPVLARRFLEAVAQ